MLSWDMPAHKACFVRFSKDRTLGQSTPSSTEMLFLVFSVLHIWAAWHFGEEQDRPRAWGTIRVVLVTVCGPGKVSHSPKMDTAPSWNQIPGDSFALPWVFSSTSPSLTWDPRATPVQALQPCRECLVLTSLAAPCPPHPLPPPVRHL